MTVQERARYLSDRYSGLEGEALLGPLLLQELPGQVAALCSFGTESALLLHMIAQIDRATPVIFIDTGKLFGETLRYRDLLSARLGLTDLRLVRPEPGAVARHDPGGTLWRRDPDACCALRKVGPLEPALAEFAACISGRKCYHRGARATLPAISFSGRHIQIAPLAGYTRDRVLREFEALDLPRHPLEADGFLSIGCMPCTDRVAPGEDLRAGRWRGLEKTECGIHSPVHACAGRPA